MVFTVQQKIGIYHHAKKNDPNLERAGYLVRRGKNRGRAHVWRHGDTVCKMASTGGINMVNYAWSELPSTQLCANCITILEAREPSRELDAEFRAIVGSNE